jgi:hypothetical protein
MSALTTRPRATSSDLALTLTLPPLPFAPQSPGQARATRALLPCPCPRRSDLSFSPADAIIGVSFFGDLDPDDFARFDRSFVALFKILAGDAWIPGLSQLNEDGSMNMGVVTYMCSYRLVVEWILLQVSPSPGSSESLCALGLSRGVGSRFNHSRRQ